jgi:DNA-binding beta-propeller fold protein YncE
LPVPRSNLAIALLTTLSLACAVPAFAQESAPNSAEGAAAAAHRLGTTKVDLVDSGAPADLLVLHKIRTQLDQPGNLAFVNSVTGEVVARVPLGREPHEVAASTDGKWALASNTGANSNPGNTLSLIDLHTRKEVRRIDLGPITSPHGVWYNNGLFYFTAEGAKLIGAYDPETDHIVLLLGTGQDTTHNLVVSKDGNTIFTANRGSNTVSMFERIGKPGSHDAWKHTIIPVCRSPQGLDLSPDGKELWAGCRGSAEIAVINAAQHKVVETFPTHVEQLARVRFTPDGKRVLIAGIAKGEITFWDAATRTELKRIKLGNYAEGILITPDGKRAFIGVTTDDNVAEINLDTMEVTRRLHTGLGPDGMAWIGPR